MSMPDSYEPPFPAYCARLSPSVTEIVMAIFGAQHRNKADVEDAGALQKLQSFLEKDAPGASPKHWDLAAVTDAQGYYNECVIAYWDNQHEFERWQDMSGFSQWWTSLDVNSKHGWFSEIFMPSVDRVETVYSDLNEPEGHGHMREKLSGTIQEHVYWGSMRDRLPASQVDRLVGERPTTGEETTEATRMRVKVPGKTNLCLIRSGQDWSKTNPEERKLYLETMHPVLIEGMNFLRDHGDEVGCYSLRLMNVLDRKSGSSETDQTFGLGYFDDIANLEKWSKEHQTHLNIFGGFMQYVKRLNLDVTLHLYHEVFVLKPEQQFFEYVGCHPNTGMLGGFSRGADM